MNNKLNVFIPEDKSNHTYNGTLPDLNQNMDEAYRIYGSKTNHFIEIPDDLLLFHLSYTINFTETKPSFINSRGVFLTFGECYNYMTNVLKFNENTEVFIEEDTSEPPIINTVKYKFCIHSKPDNKYKIHVFVDGEAIITCGTIQNLSTPNAKGFSIVGEVLSNKYDSSYIGFDPDIPAVKKKMEDFSRSFVTTL